LLIKNWNVISVLVACWPHFQLTA